MFWIWISRFLCLIFGVLIGMVITIKHYEDEKEQDSEV